VTHVLESRELCKQSQKKEKVECECKVRQKSKVENCNTHELARSYMVERIKSNFVPFKKDQMVWLDSRHLKTNYHKKMAPKREGPFEIEEVLGPVTYQLNLPESWQIHKVFHATLLCPY
jgi:hypothetical protein